MYKKNVRVWIVFISVVLFGLCTFMGTLSILKVSAEENQIYENDMQSGDISLTSTDDNRYVNLGSSRLSEGDQGLSKLYYIENANYFLANPFHRKNTKSDHSFGTCTTVAHQLLLGYHNYYSDRRLIPQTGSGGEIYLENDYGDLNSDPIIDSTPGSGLGRTNIGTTDEVFYGIFNKAGGADLLSQVIWNVADAADSFLTDCADGRTKNWTITYSTYDKETAVQELDAGRPVIVGFDVFGDHSSRVVVAYGYANYDGNFCYITHYGWEDGNVQMLVPESWLGYQVTMQVEHIHTYERTGQTYSDSLGTVYNGMECKKCGSTTLVNRLLTSFAGGTGTSSDPFLISSAEQFDNIRYAYTSVAISGQGYENRITYSFRLTQSITISGYWAPFTYKFAGDFDGDGYYISYNMRLTQTDINSSKYQGLFGFVVSGGKIYDLELINCSITSDTGTELSLSNSYVNVGILAGSIYSASGISNVTVTNPNITCKINNACIGAIAGSLHSTNVKNCVVREQNGTAGITNNTHGYLGGMAGLGDINRFSGGSITISLTNTAFDEDNDMMGEVVGNSDSVPSDMTTNVTMDKGSCIVAGSLITLADGSQVAVEDLTGDEMLLVWNMYTGQFDTAPILFIDRDSSAKYSVINLYFSDGSQVKVVSEHGFWNYTLNKYVYLDDTAEQYIGHWFNKLSADGTNGRVQLMNVEIRNEYVSVYSPVTYGHLCYYVNGMLSMPGGINGLFNIFEVDAETMSYDLEKMNEDIEQYGLFTYAEFSEIIDVSEMVFEAFNGQYLKVAIGKGMITEEELIELVQKYVNFLA